jgi:cell wall-associated NlpC family hydrolase
MSRFLPVICLGLAIAAAGATGCATTGATPAPFPRPTPPAGGTSPKPAPSAPGPAGPPAPAPAKSSPGSRTGDLGYGITGTALALRGTPYRNGGHDPGGFDCSGFVTYVFAQHGVAVPRTVGELYRAGREVKGAIEPGDLVFFTTVAPGASHVGIAIGGDEFVHAPSSTGEVRVERLGASYWSTRFVGARRVL